MNVVTYLTATVLACTVPVLMAGSTWSRTPYGALSVTLSLAIFGSPAAASATPTTATLSVRSVPIPVNPNVANSRTNPVTGNILGVGAAVEGELKFGGTEYGGFPPPVTHLTFLAPTGAKLHPQGFATCANATLESHEVSRCPKLSVASSVGSISGIVSFGGTRRSAPRAASLSVPK